MLFNSLPYAIFLTACYVVWWALGERRTLRHALLLVASYWFYGQTHWPFVGLLALSTSVDFLASARIHRAREAGHKPLARRWLLFSLVVNLSILATFKYFDFFSGALEQTLRGLGLDVHTLRLDLMLPVGISFYTFQSLSYSIDVYKGYLRPARSLLDYALYVSFFPQLVAGPIVRASDFLPQMDRPAPPTRERVGSGLFHILQGLCKKLLIADVLGSHMVDPLLRDGAALAGMDALDVALLGLGFVIQLYGDFAGYTDIAIGSARLLGFELLPNFDSPLRSASVEEFWRRWHISMSTWFRDYVFASLVRRRATEARVYWATLLTFLVVGLWHGASWTFVTFGLLHGVALVAGRAFRRHAGEAPFRRTAWWWCLCFLATLSFTCLSSLLYRAPDIGTWLGLVRSLGNWSIDGLALPWQIWVVLGTGVVTHMLPQSLCDRTERAWIALPAVVQSAVLVLVVLLLFGLRPPGIAPFIYFQF